MTRVDLVQGITTTIERLESTKIPYMIVGSIAGSIYGEPRLTKDLDLVLQIGNLPVERIVQAFSDGQYYIPPLEILNQEQQRRGQFNLLHTLSGLKVDCIFMRATDHAKCEFARRVQWEILSGLITWIAAPEDIILKKLEYYREGQSEKHVRDIRGILANTTTDERYLQKWIADLNLGREWQLCIA